MHRFFIPLENISGKKIRIKDKVAVHHIKDVLRLKAGDKIAAFDNRESEYSCIIEKIEEEVVLCIENISKSSERKNKIKITVACAIPKNAKFDDIVDKLTQLGVNRIIPLETERVIVKLDKEKKLWRQKRWEKIALSAAQQSQRRNLSIIDPVKKISEVLSESANYDLKFIPALFGRRKSLKEIFARQRPKNILVLIGPEGDFTPAEVESAKEAGCIPISLGESVLRVDTAAIAVASYIILNENY